MVRILTAPRQKQKTDKKPGHATFLTASSARSLEGRAMKRCPIALGVSDVEVSLPDVI